MAENQTFRQKWENFWYYYRHTVIVVLVVGVIAILFIRDFFFQETKDMKILVTTWGVTLDETQEKALEESLLPYIPDLDGDGTSTLDLRFVGLVDPDSEMGDPQSVTAMQARLAGELSDYSTVILLFDSDLELDFALNEAGVNLEDAYPDVPGVDGYHILLSETALAQDDGLADLPDTLAFYLRDNFYKDSNENKAEEYQQQVEVFENILYNQPVNE